jgi:uncharacterized protein (DUF433 family)
VVDILDLLPVAASADQIPGDYLYLGPDDISAALECAARQVDRWRSESG